MSQNPYQSYPVPGQQPPVSYVAGPTPPHVVAPAVALIVVGAIDGLQSIYALSRNLLGLNNDGEAPPNVQDKPELMEIYNALQPYQGVINTTGTVLAMLCAIVIILAGVQMLRRKMYPLCITGSILAATPCLSFLACCLVGEAVGIWAFIVLLQADVKRSFS
jgi:hypothetical protein